MKTTHPTIISALAALSVAFCIAILLFILNYLLEEKLGVNSILIILFSSLIISFVGVWMILKTLVYSEIQKIYNVLHHQPSTINYGPSSNEDTIAITHIAAVKWVRERKEEVEQLKKLEAYRKEFLGNVSHELKTPIFNIQGYVLTLLNGGLEDNKINKDYLQRAEKSIERMISMVEDLDAITQLEKGELELELEKFDILKLVNEIFEIVELEAKKKNISLILLSQNENSLFVNADRYRIKQVFSNLIINSIKYGKSGGETRVKFYPSGEKIFTEVSDNGIGIAKEHLPRVFERFYRVDKSRSREQGGTGLGLAIVKHIIEAHHQKIEVLSTEGAGSVFSFSLEKGI